MDDYQAPGGADVMTIDPVTVGPDASIETAERFPRVNQISGLPVDRARRHRRRAHPSASFAMNSRDVLAED